MNSLKNSLMLGKTGKYLFIAALLGVIVFSCSDPTFLDNTTGDMEIEETAVSRSTTTLKSWPILSSGSNSIEVGTLQYLLCAHGISCVVDRSFGPATRSAVINFQKRKGLAPDGIVGPATWSKLIITVQKGSSGNAVKAIQYQLRYRYGAPLTIDGSFGPATHDAAIKFQGKCGITQDGSVGPITWNYAIRGWVSVASTPSFTYDSIKRVIQSKGYAFFESCDYDINLVGVRSANRKADEWDDQLFVLYKLNGQNILQTFGHFTTDPGLYFLENPNNTAKGCIILAPGQYRGMYKIGLHKNQYTALVHVDGVAVNVYRDNDKDSSLDMVNLETYSGSDLNLHHGYGNTVVDDASAGCQVFQNQADLTKLLNICSSALPYNGTTFTYTLLDYKDFN